MFNRFLDENKKEGKTLEKTWLKKSEAYACEDAFGWAANQKNKQNLLRNSKDL